jgi:hypothetical protein
MHCRIRAFRATTDPEACLKFIEGHKHVLELVGVNQVTSSKNEWMYNPASFAIIVESLDKQKVYGGARVNVANGITPLPIEEATGYMDEKIYNMVKILSQDGTGELCGSWNSREASGLGIGAFFITRAGIAIAEQIGISSIWALCAPYTVKFSERVGCITVDQLGNHGTFYYPKEDLLATAVLLEDTEKLSTADPYEVEKIRSLRLQPKQFCRELVPYRTREIDIEWDLEILDANKNEFKLKNKI